MTCQSTFTRKGDFCYENLEVKMQAHHFLSKLERVLMEKLGRFECKEGNETEFWVTAQQL